MTLNMKTGAIPVHPLTKTRRLPFPLLCKLSILLPALTLSLSTWAQPRVETTRILFEPMQIPATEDQALPLVSFNNLSSETVEAPAVNRGLSSTERNEIEGTISNYVLAIGDEESEEGPYSEHLGEDLFSAGQLAQELGDHERALDFFTRAQYVSRINNGLQNLEQIDLMLAMIESHMALNQLKQADEIQKGMLDLSQQIYGTRSIEVVPAMLDYGVWHMDAFLDRSNILLNIDRMNVAQFINDPMNYINSANNLRDTPLFNLYQAQQSFLHAIDILIQNREYFHPRILELEQMLLKTYFLSIHRENILYEPDFYLTRKKRKTGSRLNTNAIELLESEEYTLGLESHDRSLAYILNNPEHTNEQLAKAMLEEADWDLLFERKVKASRGYADIYMYYSQLPEIEEALQSQLYPEFPVILPVYLPPPNSREKLEIAADEDVRFFGYFDVSYSISKYGKAKDIEFLGQGGEVTRNMEIRLSQYLQKVLFRPLFQDGKPYTESFSLRYYVGI